MMQANNEYHDLFNKIHKDPQSLSAFEKKQVVKHSDLQAELQLFHEIQSSIENLPLQSPPSILRELVFKKILEPVYRIWHIAIAMLFIMMSPLLLAYASREFNGILEDSILITIFAFYGLLVVLLLLPLAYQLARRHEKQLENFKINCDEYLDQGAKSARRYLSR